MIKPMDFCRVASRKETKGSDLEVGQLVLVASLKPLPIKKSDPYLQRIYSVVLILDEDGNVLVPNEENEHSSYLIDPRNLNKISDEEQEQLTEKINAIYEGKREDATIN